MKASFSILFLVTILISSIAMNAFGSSRVNRVVDADVTERLESIEALKKSLKDLNLQLQVLNTALEEAKLKKNHKNVYLNTRKIADAVTALTVLGGAIATYRFKNDAKVLKIATFIGGLSTSTSVLASLMADLSTDQAEIVQGKIDDLQMIIKATYTNLGRETKLLCSLEASNQMCR